MFDAVAGRPEDSSRDSCCASVKPHTSLTRLSHRFRTGWRENATIEHPRRPKSLAIDTSDFKNGMHFYLDGEVFTIVEFQHVKPGKGGAYVRTKLRKLKTGQAIEKTFRA